MQKHQPSYPRAEEITMTVRWTPRRKAEVIERILHGDLPRDEALQRYALSDQELVSWIDAIDAWGVPGLRATRLQCYNPKRRKR